MIRKKKCNSRTVLSEDLLNREMNDEIRQPIERFEIDHRIHLRRFRWFLNYLKVQYDTMPDRHRAKCIWCLSVLSRDPHGAENNPEVRAFLRFCRKAADLTS